MKSHSSISSIPPEITASFHDVAPETRTYLEEAWTLSGLGRPAAPVPDATRKAEVWNTLEAALRVPEKRTNRSPLRLVRTYSVRWTAIAASIIILLGVGYQYWIYPVSVTVPNGTAQWINLPDGSEAEINSGSSLSYRRLFSLHKRVVQLDGEAFFAVVNGTTPFVVETFNAETSVLGTQFNVRARRDDDLPVTSVFVASGRVRLSAKNTRRESIILEAGQASYLAAGTASPTAPDSVPFDRALAWRKGNFAFSNQPFGSIFAEMERRYDIEILADSSIQQIPYSFWLHEPEGVENVLSTLTQAAGLRYRETANGFEVFVP